MDPEYIIELMNQFTPVTEIVSVVRTTSYKHMITVLVTYRQGDKFKTDRWVRRWQKGVNIFRWEVLNG